MSTTGHTRQSLVEHLLGSALFAGIDVATLENLHPPFEWMTVEGGQRILQQGDVGTHFYMLVHGRLKVSVDDADGTERQVGHVSAGQGVGEMSLIGHRTVSANVTAERDSDLIRCSSETFADLLRTSPSAALNITRIIIDRLDAALHGAKVDRKLSTIVLAAATPSVDLDAASRKLEAALTLLGSVGVIRQSESNVADFNAYLHAQEDRFSHVLLVCPFGSEEWQERCIRQGDRVLLLANAEENPAAATQGAVLGRTPADLVLLHGHSFRRDTFSTRWRERFALHEVYHVRKDQPADFQRLSRIVTGRANNLVLSGGAAHSFVQIGVIRALQEAGIPIDRVCGTSMGALIAAQHSMGLSCEKMIEQNRRIWVDGKPLSDFTFPAMALVRGRKLQTLVRDALGEQDIEDLPIPFSCTSTNLTHARQEFHRSGSLWRAVRASGTIPGIGPPLFVDGDLLVDGGVLSNSPMGVFMRHYAGSVISVDAGVRSMAPVDLSWNDRVDSGWSMLWHRLNPFRTSARLPSIVDILYRTATVGSVSGDRRSAEADLHFSFDVAEYPPSRFSAIEAIAEKGYLLAREQLAHADLSAFSR
ncbi:MAG: hypothetical protein JWO05_250 [Gemmatimonadetes bacterium]|nr:hypothetical protein [Gemmatimonadota bacterium]